jgi:hypothetical protein
MRRALLMVVGLGFLAGCGTTPVKYDAKASYAMNVARAANIDNELKDAEVPQETMASLSDSAAYGIAYAASGYNAPVKGFTPASAAAVNFASWLLTPEAKSARNHLIAWMPEAQAGNDPVNRLAEILLEASRQAAHELGYATEDIIYEKNGPKPKIVGVSLLKSGGDECSINEGPTVCWVAFGVEKPRHVEHSPDIAPIKGGNYFFDPSKSFRSYFMFPKENHGLDELEVLLKVSQYSPEWLYFYVAPKKIRVGREQPIAIPLVIHQGKAHYFVRPSSGAQ